MGKRKRNNNDADKSLNNIPTAVTNDKDNNEASQNSLIFNQSSLVTETGFFSDGSDNNTETNFPNVSKRQRPLTLDAESTTTEINNNNINYIQNSLLQTTNENLDIPNSFKVINGHLTMLQTHLSSIKAVTADKDDEIKKLKQQLAEQEKLIDREIKEKNAAKKSLDAKEETNVLLSTLVEKYKDLYDNEVKINAKTEEEIN